MLRYRAKLREIKVIITEEFYTSQSSCLDGDDLPTEREKKPKFSGKRVTRELYKTREKKLLNVDFNGSFHIIEYN